MKHILRPRGRSAMIGLLAASVALTSPWASAQVRGIVDLLETPNALMAAGISQGYLGVDLADVDQVKAQALKLKDVRGAIITLIDHDAPAGQVGLRVNDVLIKLNGQVVEGAAQFRRMLQEIPAGRTVSLEISRDGTVQTLQVELADRRAMEHAIWKKLGESMDIFTPAPKMGSLPDGDLPPTGSGFHVPFFGSSLNVGALVEPLTGQMADFLAVKAGLMVKEVTPKSEAAAAGMQAFDVILQVGSVKIYSLSDWERALRANLGKPVQVIVLREKKQQTLTLQVDSKRHGMLEVPGGELSLARY